MRRVVYRVKRENGKFFRTVDYFEAIESGNRIVRIDYIEIDSETPEQHLTHRARAQKVWMKEHLMKESK